jgi:hypothetical protein
MPRLFSLSLLALTLAVASACTQQEQKPFPEYNSAGLDAPAVPAGNEPAIFATSGTVKEVVSDEMGRPAYFIMESPDHTRQVRFPDELAVALGSTLKSGEPVDVVIARAGTAGPPTGGTGDTPLYKLVSLREKDGKMYAAPSMASNRFAHVAGTIKSVNKDANGTISMVLLDTGDVIRLTPRMAKQHPIQVGDSFSADGLAVYLPTGGHFVFAEEVNGLAMRALLPPGGWGRPAQTEDAGDYGDEGVGYSEGDFGGGGDRGIRPYVGAVDGRPDDAAVLEGIGVFLAAP